MSEQVFAVAGAVQFHAGYLQGLENARADSEAKLTESVLSDEVMAGTIQRERTSYYAILGPNYQQTLLQKELQVSVDVPADKLEIRLESPYPHEAAAVVNAVIHSWISSQKRQLVSASTSLVDPAAITSVSIDTAKVLPLGLSPIAILATGAALGFILGIVLALYRGLLDERVRPDIQLEEATGLNGVGGLPVLSSQFSRVGRGLASYIQPTSEAGIQCCSLLLKAFRDAVTQDSGTYLITSPARGDGRSTVALNLATTLAEAGESVVLVDADLEAPIGSKLLEESEAGQGLCEALAEPKSAASFAHATHIKNLHLLSCHNPSPVTGQRLQGVAMSNVLAHLRKKFTYVLLDSGPLLGDSAAAKLAAHCDGTFLVLHAEKTRLTAARHCRKLLQESGSTSVFAIVNARHRTARRNYLKYLQGLALPKAASNEEYQDIYHYGWFQQKRAA